MLERHDCIYCGMPVVVNVKTGKVFSLSCLHECEAMFYVPVPNTPDYFATTVPEWPMPIKKKKKVPQPVYHPHPVVGAQVINQIIIEDVIDDVWED